MKKMMTIVLCFLLTFSAVGCESSATKNVKIDYGTSDIYTEKDMNDAIHKIKETFKSMDGCELHSLSYASDEVCTDEENIAWLNNLRSADEHTQIFTQCMMFDSSFRSPKKGGGAWEPDEEYTWSWWLARSEGGEWKLMAWGY